MAAAAAATATLFRCPMIRPTGKSRAALIPGALPLRPSFVRFFRKPTSQIRIVCMASSAAGSPYESCDENPYEVLGVSSKEGFEKMKLAYKRKRKDAEEMGDEAYAAKLEKAYDTIMMSQLQSRKKGSVKVPNDIKYADDQPIVPWGPRHARSTVKDILINTVISAVFTIWIQIQRSAEWKPLQFLAFGFFYRIFDKLKAFQPAVKPTLDEYGEEEGRGLRMGKRILRSLALVFGCIAVSSLGYTGLLSLMEAFGRAIPYFLYNNQELFVTVASAITLFIIASFYR